MLAFTAHTINEAAFRAISVCMQQGRTYRVERGSFKGTLRKQLDALGFTINRPSTRPLASEMNGMPLSSEEDILRYYVNYLISPQVRINEVYTYGERLAPYLERVATMLRETPMTNQAVIEIARPDDILLDDPPCLRLLSWRVIPSPVEPPFLQLTSYWRSWDAFAALPMNLGGLQLLNETMAEWTGMQPGSLVCFSDGLHIYEHTWGLIKC